MAGDITGDLAWADPAADGLPGSPPGTLIVVVSGELDVVTVPSAGQRLARVLAERPQRLVLDMAQVAFIDCAAARLIVGAGRHLPDGRLIIRRPSAAVRRILKLTGLDAHCEVEG